ncbi:MAG: NADH-quinone oxidoreductase subunit A [Candidatus Omnitrophica bacterium]|nr:NADH-quinone oxidoreductase subunit A [Candidatus Omnitrophota bacterium]
MEFVGLLLLALLAALVATGMLLANRLLGPRRPNPVKSQPFECGMEPIALPAGRIPVHFYVMAMLFVVFDVELVFLFPWAVVLKELGWFGLVEMALFLGIVVAGFIYAWKKGALDLEWERRV